MTTVSTLLQSLGPPPVAVCLDWACQLEARLQDAPNAPVDWSCIVVQTDGTLSIEAEEELEGCSTAKQGSELVRQLLIWAGVEETDGPLMASPQVLELIERYRAADEHIIQTAERHEQSTSPEATDSRTITEDTESLAVLSDAQRPRVGSSITPLAALKRRRAVLIGSVGSLAVLAVVLGFQWITSERGASMAVSTAGTQKSESVAATGDPAIASRSGYKQENQSSDSTTFELQTLSPTATVNDDVPRVSTGQEFPQLTSPEIDISNLVDKAVGRDIGGFNNAAEIVDAPANDGGEASEVGTEFGLSVESSLAEVATTELGDSMASEPPQQNVADVLGELESVTRSAEESRSSVAMTLPDLAADEAANGHAGPHSEPLKLGTFPILQLQEAPAQVRVREPRWELRIVAAEGFQVLPQVSQELTGRDVLTWKVVPEDVADSAKATLVFIQARLPKNRNADVQWRIVAGCEDVPQIAVPLGQQFLDQYQAVLRRTTDQLKFEVERLRDAGRTSGLPSELKSAFSVSRRAAESQMKLATRVAEVVADANQYASWLDGQFEVHARLRDSSKPDVLLQFGEPDLQDPEPASKEPMDE